MSESNLWELVLSFHRVGPRDLVLVPLADLMAHRLMSYKMGPKVLTWRRRYRMVSEV